MAHFEISLKATQADGMYYPPEWRPEHGDLDTFQGGHKLGNQAKKISQVKLPFENLEHIVNLLKISNLYLLILHIRTIFFCYFIAGNYGRAFAYASQKLGLTRNRCLMPDTAPSHRSKVI